MVRCAGPAGGWYSRRAGVTLTVLVRRSPAWPCFSWRNSVSECEVEVSVGETLCLGDISVTILGIEDGEIHFRIDSAEEGDEPDPEFEDEPLP